MEKSLEWLEGGLPARGPIPILHKSNTGFAKTVRTDKARRFIAAFGLIFLGLFGFLAVACNNQPSTSKEGVAPRGALELVFPYGSVM